MENQTVIINGMSNREFLERHAHPGRVGLCGGTTKVDLAIRHAPRHLHAEHRWSDWSHSFLFEGRRLDGQHWVLESEYLLLREMPGAKVAALGKKIKTSVRARLAGLRRR